MMALTLAAKGGGIIEVRYAGKLATFLLYGAIPAFYLAKAGVMEWLMWPTAYITGVVGLVLYWYVAIRYIGDSRDKLAALKSPPEPEEV
jgi:phosphatidylglycerophosphate synthase